jgi:transcriptional regulator
LLIHQWDASTDDHEWRAFLASHEFGDLVAGGRNRDLPVVVPTQFVLRDDEVLIHLIRTNPIWTAIEENPNVLLSVAGDWAYIPSDWKTIDDEDPRRGIPTTYYAAVQLTGTARLVDDPEGIAEVRAKFKYGGNVDVAHRESVATRLRDRSGPGDDAALAHLQRRLTT